MAMTLQTVPLPQGDAWMFNHNRATTYKAVKTALGVDGRLVIAHAIRLGLIELQTRIGNGEVMADFVAEVENEAANA